MTYSQAIVMSVLLNIGMVYIIYRLFLRNQELEKALKDVIKQAEGVLRKAKPKNPTSPTPPKKKNFWKIYD